MAQGGDDAFHLGDVFVSSAQLLAQLRHGRFQDHGPGARRQRQRSAVDRNLKLALGEVDLDLLILQHAAVLIAEHRQQNFVHQLFLRRMPVDIEEPGEGTAGAVLQHVPPPDVGGVRDAHVVGNHVGDQRPSCAAAALPESRTNDSSSPISGLKRA